MVKWLRLCASTAGGVGSIPGQGTKIPQAMSHRQYINNVILKHKNAKVKILKINVKHISEVYR